MTEFLTPRDDDVRLDDLAAERPLRRAMAVAEALGRRPLPGALIDAAETLGDLRHWSEASADTSSSFRPATGEWPIRTPRAVLRPVAPVDLGAIHAAFNDPATAWRLPSRGRTVRPSAVERVLDGADLQLLGAVAGDPAVAVTLMALNRHDPLNGTADLTIVGLTRTNAERSMTSLPRGVRFETVGMFISHAFEALDLSKITASIPDFNWPFFADGMGVYFEREGVLQRHVAVRGSRHDVHLVAIFREHWREIEPTIEGAFNAVIPDGST